MPWTHLLLIVCGGLLGTLGHFLFILAFRHAPASSITPFTYMQLVWATLAGWIVYRQFPDAFAIAGMIVIAGSGLLIALLDRRRARLLALDPLTRGLRDEHSLEPARLARRPSIRKIKEEIDMSKPRIGFIGVGLMGHGIAKNLIAKGYPVTLRAASQPRGRPTTCWRPGATEATSHAELARGSRHRILCVTGAPQVEEVVLGADGIATRRARGTDRRRHVDERAGDDDAACARCSPAKGVRFVDAPLARTPVEAEQGQAQHHGRRRRRDVRAS